MSAVRKTGLAAVAALVAAVSGCGQQAPGCADAKTHELLSQMLFDSVAAQTNLAAVEPGWINTVKKHTKVSVTTIRTIGTDKETGKVHCEAKLVVQLPNDAESADVEYTSQLTDDKQEHLVEMAGHTTLALIVGSMARKPDFKRATSTTSSVLPPAAALPQSTLSPLSPQTAAGSDRLIEATLVWLECGDLCHLKYKTSDGTVRSALCIKAPLCQQWAMDEARFSKYVGARATLKLRSEFVP